MKGSKLIIILLPIVAVVALIAIFGFFFINGQPKEVATVKQVMSAMTERGFTPVDSTDTFRSAWGENGIHLEESVSFELGSTKMHFFVTDSDSFAQSLRSSYFSYLKYKSGRFGTSGTNIEYSSSMANFTVYTVKTDKYYSVCTRVGNTVLYAEADIDANKQLLQIIEKIGYN